MSYSSRLPRIRFRDGECVVSKKRETQDDARGHGEKGVGTVGVDDDEGEHIQGDQHATSHIGILG
jgi:hypothetical protein